MADSIQVSALKRAEQLLGITELARRLNAPVETVKVWRNGIATMPERKFLLVVDILDEAGEKPAPDRAAG